MPLLTATTDALEPDSQEVTSWWPFKLNWSPTSSEALRSSEYKLLNSIRCQVESFFVPIFQRTAHIRTVVARSITNESELVPAANNTSSAVPLVLVHGFASGVGLWCKNIDALAVYRPVYAFDLIGFGRSSRPEFPTSASDVEQFFVQSLEEWRSEMKLEKFILLGHSLGGYIGASYTLAHPHRVTHLILADPWGFPELPRHENSAETTHKRPVIMRAISNMLKPFNPLAILRAVGPFGPKLVHNLRQDIREFFDQRPVAVGDVFEVPSIDDEMATRVHIVESESDKNNRSSEVDTSKSEPQQLPMNGSDVLDYIYHANARKPSGEVGFKRLSDSFGWSQRPMLHRIGEIDPSVPITFIYGSRSWMDVSSGLETKQLRPDSYVDVKVIEGAGHQVYAQMADEFNAYVNSLTRKIDAGDLLSSDVPFVQGAGSPIPLELKDDEIGSSHPHRKHSHLRVDDDTITQHIANSNRDSKPLVLRHGDEASDEASD